MANEAAVIEAVARAAFAVWQNNGHSVPDALLVVHNQHVNGAVRAQAGVEYDTVLQRRIMWDAYDMRFAEWAKAERAAG